MSDRINVAVATLCTSGLAKDGKGSRATDTPKSWFQLFGLHADLSRARTQLLERAVPGERFPLGVRFSFTLL